MDKFVTAINCIDGRVQEPVTRYLKRRFDAQFVDMITCPAPVKLLSAGDNELLIRCMKQYVSISTTKHFSKVLAIVAHYDCAANDISQERQLQQLAIAMDFVSHWNNQATIVGLWVNACWETEEINNIQKLTMETRGYEFCSDFC